MSTGFVYREEYNITFACLERLHPFDTCKFSKIAKELSKHGIDFQCPEQVDEKMLRLVHTKKYLQKLKESKNVAELCEFFMLKFVPNRLLRYFLLDAMLYQVGGTILAGEIACENGWSINIGGGMHHASSRDGGGWCVYSDIPLSIKNLRKQGKIQKAMIIDLDVHQGNGIEKDIRSNILSKNDTYMIDCYNHYIYPGDTSLRKHINIDIDVTEHTSDRKYLSSLRSALKKGLRQFKPDIVFYNAGTDILEGDPLNGGVSISQKGVISRDELVMETFVKNDIPIVMVLSGGYSAQSADVISKSLVNLYQNILPC